MKSYFGTEFPNEPQHQFVLAKCNYIFNYPLGSKKVSIFSKLKTKSTLSRANFTVFNKYCPRNVYWKFVGGCFFEADVDPSRFCLSSGRFIWVYIT